MKRVASLSVTQPQVKCGSSEQNLEIQSKRTVIKEVDRATGSYCKMGSAWTRGWVLSASWREWLARVMAALVGVEDGSLFVMVRFGRPGSRSVSFNFANTTTMIKGRMLDPFTPLTILAIRT